MSQPEAGNLGYYCLSRPSKKGNPASKLFAQSTRWIWRRSDAFIGLFHGIGFPAQAQGYLLGLRYANQFSDGKRNRQ